MNYDIKILNNKEGKGRLEFKRLEILCKHLKETAQKALSLELYGYSNIKLDSSISKALSLYLNEVRGEDGFQMLVDTEEFGKLVKQTNIFNDYEELANLTPMALVIRSFTNAFSDTESNNLVDGPLVNELLNFKKFFINDEERILLTNRQTIPEIEFSKKDLVKLEKLTKLIPSPQSTTISGLIDEMKFSKAQVVLSTYNNEKIAVSIKKELFSKLKEYFGKEITLSGTAHFKPGGQLSYIEMDAFDEADEKTAKYFSKAPRVISMQQEIALQIKAGKKPNPINEIFGQWPGDESDEEFNEMMKSLD